MKSCRNPNEEKIVLKNNTLSTLKTDATAFITTSINSTKIDKDKTGKQLSKKRTLQEQAFAVQLAFVSLEKEQIGDRNVLSQEEKVFGMVGTCKTSSKMKFIKTLAPKKVNIHKPVLGKTKDNSNKIEQYFCDSDIAFQK